MGPSRVRERGDDARRLGKANLDDFGRYGSGKIHS